MSRGDRQCGQVFQPPPQVPARPWSVVLFNIATVSILFKCTGMRLLYVLIYMNIHTFLYKAVVCSIFSRCSK